MPLLRILKFQHQQFHSISRFLKKLDSSLSDVQAPNDSMGLGGKVSPS